MSTILNTQERVSPLVLNAPVESTRSLSWGIMDVISEIGYCLKLSAQSLSFSMTTPAASTYSASSAARLDSWPVDLWVF